MDPSISASDQGATLDHDSIAAERLKQVIGRLESGFYETPEVREQIARKVRKELDP